MVITPPETQYISAITECGDWASLWHRTFVPSPHTLPLKCTHKRRGFSHICTVKYCCCCLVTKLCPPRTVALQAPLSMGFLRQKYQSGLPYPPPGDLPKLGIEPTSPAWADGFFTTEPPAQPVVKNTQDIKFTILAIFKCKIQEH